MNKLCERCTQKCKQESHIKIIVCPNFEEKDVKNRKQSKKAK